MTSEFGPYSISIGVSPSGEPDPLFIQVLYKNSVFL